MKGSSSPSNVESKKERSKTRFRIPIESVTSTVKSNEPNPESDSTSSTVNPVAVYSTSKEVPSTSTDIVSAYTRAVESIVNKIRPSEIFNKELTLGSDVCLSEYSSFTAKLFICIF